MEKSGLYIHIPFCKNKCPYCDFYSVKYDARLSEEYTQQLICEIKKYKGSFDTVYFGGGTPSIIESTLIEKIIDACYNQFEIADNAEITIECNPSKDLSNSFRLYKSCGINRVSIGMQSAVDRERLALGRSAGKAQLEKTVNAAKDAGIKNISLDVMLGTPKQTLASLDETFNFIEKMNVSHISAYMLKIEESTPFFRLKNKLELPDENTVSQMYFKTIDTLKSLGFEQYEISNFAKPGFESRHNLKYWQLNDYLGIGAGAHSLWHGKRFFYDENFNIINDGSGGNYEEQIMLGLRLNRGISKKLVKSDYSRFVKLGFMTESHDKIALTPKGMLVSNYIISELI